MELKTSVTLNLDGIEVSDCQLWGSGLLDIQFSGSYDAICKVNRRLVPIYLFSSKPLMVYTDNDATAGFFMKELVQGGHDIGYLFRLNDSYLVFYHNQQQIQCQPIDFEVLKMMEEESEEGKKPKLRTNSILFDRVVVLKAKVEELAPEPPKLNSNETQTINKLILSGLRLRGMSFKQKNISNNERLMIKEIYQMTQKSTQFALRKYNYSQNQPNDGIRLHDIQDIVELLLDVFIDIKSPGPPSHGMG